MRCVMVGLSFTILSETPSALASCVALPSASILTYADPHAGYCEGLRVRDLQLPDYTI
jgi:hypothetical protein